MNLIGVKVAALIFVAVFKFGVGVLPIFLLPKARKMGLKHRTLDKCVAGILCVGGGFLLGTVFLHMVPEIRESVTKAFELQTKASGDVKEEEHSFPLAELLVCCGFLVIYAIEAIVHRVIWSKKKGGGHSHTALPADLLDDAGDNVTPENPTPGADNPAFCHEKVNYAVTKDPPDNTNGTALKMVSKGQEISDNPDSSSDAYPEAKIPNGGLDDESGLPNNNNKKQCLSEVKKKPMDETKEKKMLFSLRNFLIVFALSVHGIFEGMALGVQLSLGDVLKLLLALVIHHGAIHFCVGMEMFSGGIKKLHIIGYFVTLGTITPIGIIIGIVATLNAENGFGSAAQSMVIAVLQGLGGGTLLYITFYEVLDRERLGKNGMTGLTGCFLLLVGFAAMVVMKALGGHSDNS